MIDNNNFEDAIFFNELETIVERVGTDKEFCLFLLLCKGVSYEKIGSIFDVQAQRVRQMFNALLDKLEWKKGYFKALFKLLSFINYEVNEYSDYY